MYVRMWRDGRNGGGGGAGGGALSKVVGIAEASVGAVRQGLSKG